MKIDGGFFAWKKSCYRKKTMVFDVLISGRTSVAVIGFSIKIFSSILPPPPLPCASYPSPGRGGGSRHPPGSCHGGGGKLFGVHFQPKMSGADFPEVGTRKHRGEFGGLSPVTKGRERSMADTLQMEGAKPRSHRPGPQAAINSSISKVLYTELFFRLRDHR